MSDILPGIPYINLELRGNQIYLLQVRYVDLNARVKYLNAHPGLDPIVTVSGDSVARSEYMSKLNADFADVKRRLTNLGVDFSDLD